MLSRPSTHHSRTHIALVILAALVWPAARLASQSITVNVLNGVVHVRAPQVRFIDGEPLARLKDGQSVRVDLELSALPKPGAAAAAQSRLSCILSYDLWEERFAVTLSGPPSKSVAYLTSTGAEAWCLGQLTVPVAALGSLGRDAPFWVRLEYRILDVDPPVDRKDDAAFTLKGLIDALSSRKQAAAWTHTIEAGPFRLRP
jgi:hypothetical protein